MTDPDYGPATDHPNDPRNDFDGSPYCECGEDPTEDELAEGRCDACGGLLAESVDPLAEAAEAEAEWYGNHPDYR